MATAVIVALILGYCGFLITGLCGIKKRAGALAVAAPVPAPPARAAAAAAPVRKRRMKNKPIGLKYCNRYKNS